VSDQSNHALITLSQQYFEWEHLPENLSAKEAFIDFLSKEINYLLQKDLPKLLRIIYRIDIPEREFDLTLSGNYGNNIAELLAAKIYDRLLLKVKYRMKYQ
jgi:hypothetical protein